MSAENNTRELVHEKMKHAILDHTYPLGSRINLDEIKRSLGVSNTPVREAVSILEGEGLVEYKRNAGVFVVNPTREEVFALAQFMMLLVGAAYDFCRDSRSMEPLIVLMRAELEKQRGYVQQKDFYNYALCSNSFDRCIIDYTENDYLIRSYNQNYDLLTLLNAEYAIHDESTIPVFFHQHELILEAIEKDDPALVHSRLKEHYYKKDWIPAES
ncbi:MAG: GntR family transcriptional regulator [Eubacteriales bacterium]|nr:GntR family transcriptional regulator [Eubacteriales bacterium]